MTLIISGIVSLGSIVSLGGLVSLERNRLSQEAEKCFSDGDSVARGEGDVSEQLKIVSEL